MCRRARMPIGVGLLAGVVLAAQPAGQSPPDEQPQVTFRVEVNYVEVDAIVTDAEGRFVRDLRQDEFEIFEDDKPQAISTFARVDIPVERAERPLFADAPIPPDVRSNEGEFDGRLYVMVLDDLHTHPLRSARVKRAAQQFVERYVAANDLMAVVHTSGRTDAGQEFTSDRRLLLAAVDKFLGRKPRSSTLERIDSYNNTVRPGLDDRINDPLEFERSYNARSAMDTLQNLSTYLEGVRGRRKTILFVSEGIDYDTYDVFNNRDATTILDDVRDAIGAATRSNVTIYAIDPRGLTALGDESIEIAGLPDNPNLGLGTRSLQDELRLSQDSLRVVSEETGGFAAVNANDLTSAFDRIVAENSSYYLLGYYPTDDRRNGRLRKISVRATRPGLTVRARKGYVAPRGRAKEPPPTADGSAAIRNLISSPLPMSGLTFNAHAAAFKGIEPNVSVVVTVEFDPRDLTFVERDGIQTNNLEISMIALNEKGEQKGSDRATLELKLRPQTYEAVQRAGLRVTSRLEVPPGRYQLRLAAHESGRNRSGSVFYDLAVPDLGKEKMSLSGVVVASAAAAMTPTARPDELLGQVLAAPPTTRRTFSTADTLAVFAEVYDNTGASHTVDITTTLRADDGRVVFSTSEERQSSELAGARGGYGHIAQIPLDGINPGLYVLRVEGRSRLSGTEPVSRDVALRVVAAEGRVPPPVGSGAGPGPSGPPTADPAVVQFVEVAHGPYSGVSEAEDMVIRTAGEWETLWRRLPTRQDVPPVNFETTMLVGVFLGARPSAGYTVEVVGVRREGGGLVVEFAEDVPGPAAAVARTPTSPFRLVGVPRTDGDVRFTRRP